MSAHTPGPWKVKASTGDVPERVQNKNGDVVAFVFAPKGYNPLIVMAEVGANAALIAAAPEMLERLKQVRRYCPVSVQDSLDLLIARAEGRQP